MGTAYTMVMAHKGRKRKKVRSTAKNPWPGILNAFRERHDLSQQAAADLASVTRRAWLVWENGEHPPSPAYATLLRLLIENRDRTKRKN